MTLLQMSFSGSIPLMFSAYSIVKQSASVQHTVEETPVADFIPSAPAARLSLDVAPVTPEAHSQVDVWFLVWCLGMILFAAYFDAAGYRLGESAAAGVCADT